MIDPRTPVLVGVGVAMDRDEDPSKSDEAVELMIRAARTALDDSGARGLTNRIGAVGAMGSMSRYRDPAALVRDGLGLNDDVIRLRADPGTLQQKVFNWAAEHISNGMDATLVVSGEAQYRTLRASITGVDAPITQQAEDAEPDLFWKVGRGLLSTAEFDAKMFDAPQHYAWLEFALARHLDRPLADHMAYVAELMSRQSAASVGNEDAWHREFFPPERIQRTGDGNRLVSWPYAKWHNSQWNVNQGAALLFCAAEVAESMGIAKDKWIFMRGGAVSNFMQPVSVRPELHRAPWVKASADAALELAGLGIEDMDAMELYTCFPVAVEVQAREMGIDLSTRLHTITGGMTFAGGPFNSWVLHSVVAMAQRLRETGTRHGIVTSVSGMLTKHATGVWSTEPDDGGLRIADVTSAMDTLPAMPLIEDHLGVADVVAVTVAHDRQGPTHAVALGETRGARLVAVTTDEDTMEAIMADSDSIQTITVTADGFSL